MAKRDFSMVSTNTLEIIESPLTILLGMEPLFSVTIAGSGTIANATMKLFKGTKDVSSTNLTGTIGINGRTLTCKKITSLSAGVWAFYLYFEDDGVLTGRFCRFTVPRESA